MQIRFIVIGEGATEHGFVDHLRLLCIAAGASEASGDIPPFERLRRPVGHQLTERLRAAQLLCPDANLYFLHRDADGDNASARYQEIEHARSAAHITATSVAIVPIHETEAWLLLDAEAIRRVAGNPNGRSDLNLPPIQRIEQTPRPKERLKAALRAAAANLTGKRLDRFIDDFPKQRRQLLEDLPIEGELEQLAAWRRLRDDTRAAIDELRNQRM